MASRSLAYRKLRRRGIPHFMGRAEVLVHPRTERRAASGFEFLAESLVVGARPVVLTQQGSQWCWAALCQALLALEGISKSQQEIVNEHTGRQCPITSGGSDLNASCTADRGCAVPCDQPHSVLLGMQGLHRPVTRIFDPDLSQLKTALASRPVAARLQLGSRGGHMILIAGWTGVEDNPTIRYLCPIHVEGKPYPLPMEARSWTSFKSGFDLMGHMAQLSHIYPRH